MTVLLYGGLAYGAYRLARHLLAKRRESRQAEKDYQARALAVWQRAGGEVFQAVKDDQILAINRDSHEIILGTFSDPIYCHFSDLKGARVEYATHMSGSGYINNYGSSFSTTSVSMKEVVDAIYLTITIEDWDRPVHRLCFFKGGSWIGAAKEFKQAKEQVERLRENLQTVIGMNVPKPDPARLVPLKTDLTPYDSFVPVQHEFRHGLHIVLAILTGGMWVPVWITLYLMRTKYSYEQA